MKEIKERLQKVIVIGATPSGIAATNKLGEMGIAVTLIDPDPDLNEKLSADKWRMPTGATLNYALRPGLLRIMRNPRIQCLLPATVNSIKHTPQGFSVRYRKHASYVDPDKCTLCGRCAQICPAIGPDGKKAVRFGGRHSLPGRVVIDKRRMPLCQESCPLGVNVQGYVALARAGKYAEALELIRRDNVLPGICGRICTHPCEAACRRNELEGPVAIRDIKRFLADNVTPDPGEFKPARPRPERIAVAGSGPAGLAAASELARLGYRVTLFEKEREPGGLLRYGIGPHRLPRDVIDREIGYLRRLGVEFRLGGKFDIAKNDPSDRGFEAVILASGLWNDRKLRVPGEDLHGVHGCISYLSSMYRGEADPITGRVAVIGDGNSAIEAARTIVRMGAEVTLVSWFPEDMIPADAADVRDAVAEGVKIRTCLKTVGFIGENSRLARIRFAPTIPGPPDASGIAWPVEACGGAIEELEFDHAIVAVGQTANSAESRIAVTEGVATIEGKSGLPRGTIFAAGDFASGPSTVVAAMASGRKAAQAAHHRISGENPRIFSCRPADQEFSPVQRPAVPIPRVEAIALDPRERCGNQCEVFGTLDSDTVQAESLRCLQCGACSECFQCIDACSAPKAISHEDRDSENVVHGGVVIIADPAASLGIKGEDVIRAYSSKAINPDVFAMTMRGFAAAAEAMLLLGESTLRMKGHGLSFSPPAPQLTENIRIGVFACRCNDSLGWHPEMDRFVSELPAIPQVEYAEIVQSACTPEGSASILRTIREKGITRIVLASCVCCPLDLICSACTDQRARLKDFIFHGTGITRAMAEMCNLRGEALTLLHRDPELAVSRFKGLLKRSIGRAASLKSIPAPARQYNFTTAVIGDSEAVLRSAQTLGEMGMEVFLFGSPGRRLEATPDLPNVHAFIGSSAGSLKGTVGNFSVIVNMEDGTHQVFRAGAVILGERACRSIAYMPHPNLPPHEFLYSMQAKGVKGIPFFVPGATSIPGLLLANPPGINLSERIKGTAAGILAASVMPRGPRQNKGYTISIRAGLCRGCGRCITVCPYRAISLHANDPGSGYAVVDEALCKGCGNCVSICPTNAADSPFRDRLFLEGMIEEILA
ncbi:MAG: FAD-dependent oxidoreductase [Desulfobacteraceae bacterium]|nr:FAD-dependent oxidoreductase [Desulfobacteraceae bacterium]